MAAGQLKSLKILIYTICTITASTYAAPSITFPFNSQVPTVARVGRQYTFQFSPSTFAPEDTEFTYSISNQPSWLSLDGATRTLSGIPDQVDVGAVDFVLTAAEIDGVAHMACTLVVSKDPAPRMEGDISQQLAATANLSSSEPSVVTVLASSPFHFQFKQGSFIDIVQRKLYYYATLTDHTPLPSWLQFDPRTLIFSGVTPNLVALPQSWNIEMIASDVAGFGGASASFTITVAMQQLAFVPEQQFVDIAASKAVKFDGLKNDLFRNGAKVALEDLKSATASLPPWLSFDPSSLEITGTAPPNVKDQNISVAVRDKLGNQAVALIYLDTGDSTIFTGTIGTLTARAGNEFNYQVPNSLFANSDVDIQVILPETATWLHFDPAKRQLSGEVPAQISLSSIRGELVAKSATMSKAQTQAFTINIVTSTTASSGSHALTTSESATGSDTAFGSRTSRSHLSSGIIAAIILACLLAAAIFIACLIFLWWRKRRQCYVEALSPTRRTISRPTRPTDPDTITVTTELQRDVEKTSGNEIVERCASEAELAPQIALDLPSNIQGRKLEWSKRFSRLSHVSSLGDGETAIRADYNIPQWGDKSSALHNPHESFSVAAEIARASRQPSELSPRKRTLNRLLKKRQMSVQSIGLGIDTGGTTMLPHNSWQSMRSHPRAAGSMDLSRAIDQSSVTSISTRGTSVLSAKPSDFPRPPTRSTVGRSRSITGALLSEARHRKGIRLVESSDDVADERSMDEKRRSFIHHRASANFASPLFAHGAKVSSATKQSIRSSRNGRAHMGGEQSQRGNSQLTTYSESSSLEPPPRDPRRLNARVRSVFAPNFPRAVTKSSIRAADEDVTVGDTSSFYTTSSSINGEDFTAEMALPRHERSFVLPGEASPTPPPARPTSRQSSSIGRNFPPPKKDEPLQKWKQRLQAHPSSPVSTALAVPLTDPNSLSPSARVGQARRSRLSEPMSLVSNDSLSRTKPESPRLVYTRSRRPVSVEKLQRLSSLKAEAEDARPGSEMFEAFQGAGLMPQANSAECKGGTQMSNTSGPAFL